MHISPINQSPILRYLRKNSENLVFLVLLIWTILPIYIIYKYWSINITLPQEYKIERVLAIWYRPEYFNAFLLIGKISILVTFLILFLLFYPRISKNRITYVFKPWTLSLLLLISWAGICTYFANDKLLAWNGSLYRLDGYKSYFIYASVFLLSGILVQPEKRLRLLQIFSLSGIPISIIVVLQYFQNNCILEVFPTKVAAIFFQFNHTGYYLTMTTITLLGLYLYEARLWKKTIYIFSFSFQFYSLILNDTFGCFLAIWIVLPIVYIFYWMNKRPLSRTQLLPLLICLLISLFCYRIVFPNLSVFVKDVEAVATDVSTANKAGTGRMGLWKYAIESIREHPILGVGPEGFWYDVPEKVMNDRPHNEFLQYAAFLGIPGLFFYLFALISLAVNRWKQLPILEPSILIPVGSMVAYLISSCFGNTMFYTTPYFFMLFGMVAFYEPPSDKYSNIDSTN